MMICRSTPGAIAALALTLTPACTRQPEPPHNAKYYIDNSNARREQLKQCAKDRNTENPLDCVAAEDAQLVAISGT